MAIVDCMACLVTGVLTPIGFRDGNGITHRVRWSVRGGAYRLCDFVENWDGDYARIRKGAKVIQQLTQELIALEEP